MKPSLRLFFQLLLLWLGASVHADTNVVTIGPAAFPLLTAGKHIQVPLTVTGGAGPFTWSLPMTPAGVFVVNPQTGLLDCTPSTAGNGVLFAKVTDTNGVSRQRGWNLPIAAATGGTGYTGGSGGSTPPPPPPSQYVVTVINGTILGGGASGSFLPGATVSVVAGTPPSGQWFSQWSCNVPIVTASPTTLTNSFTMPSSPVNITAQFYTPPTLVQPVASHPRLWVTTNDLPRLRSWANPANPLYQQGLKPVLATAVGAYHRCFPNGVTPASPYPDVGDIYGWAGAVVSSDLNTEEQALTLAFFGLVDPVATNRIMYAQMARQMFMYEMNQAALGHAAGLPFRDPMFAIYCRGNGQGEDWPLLADWLQGVTDANGQPVSILSAADKATIRNVFMQWSVDCLNAYTTGGDHPTPIGVVNSTSLLANGHDVHRVVGNNYYANHARLITMMPLALDSADDPAINPNAPDSVLGNTLRSYFLDATGAWLYEQFALYADPATVAATYNLPAGSSVGLSSGGLPVEGGMYGHSYAFTLGQLLALQTAGFNDPNLVGPQIGLIQAPVWDRFCTGFISQMANTPIIFQPAAYLGPIYQFGSYGDNYRAYITPDHAQTYALLALLSQHQGRTNHVNEARWFARNATPGGAASLVQRTAFPWSTTESILNFMLFDPTAPVESDPRPGYATTFYDAPQARLIKRSSWSSAATLFTYRAAPESINHVNCDGGQFELWRNGEWLTKELTCYDNNGNGESSMWHNTLALKNWSQSGTATLNPFEVNYLPNGSTWNNGSSAGDPVTIRSSGTNYDFVQSDLTRLYNRPSFWTPANALLDVQHASRSLLYLNKDFVVVYDRATTLHAGLFKRFNLNCVSQPGFDLVNKTITETTPHGQHLFMKTLLPVGAAISWVPEGGTVTGIGESEPTIGRVVVEDLNCPTNATFLNVIQAGDPTATPQASQLVQSWAGTAFDGTQFGNSLVLFARDLSKPFAGTAYTASPTATVHYITGLTPNGNYGVSEQLDAVGNVQIAITSGGNLTADAAGVLVFNP